MNKTFKIDQASWEKLKYATVKLSSPELGGEIEMSLLNLARLFVCTPVRFGIYQKEIDTPVVETP